MICNSVSGNVSQLMPLFAMLLSFITTIVFTLFFKEYLPKDGGRAFAVEGEKSAGKPRGAGIIFILSFALSAFLFTPMTLETGAYVILVIVAMITGFLDDASSVPWTGMLKGILDFIIAVLVAVVFLLNNSTFVRLGLAGLSFSIPAWAYGICIVALVWVSINVTNCTDGVDGLSGIVSIIVMMTFYGIMCKLDNASDFRTQILAFVFALLAYLWFNATPSILMMGDAGSRAMGLFIAICAIKSGTPFLYLLVAIVLILDGGLGLLKVFLLRYFKIGILKNIRTPIHDQVRKVNNWSNTQCVFRFAIIQLVIGIVVYSLVR